MIQIEYSETTFNNSRFYYAGINSHFVYSTLIRKKGFFKRKNKKWSEEKYNIHQSLNVSEEIAIDKLGDPNFRALGYEWFVYWVYEFKGNIFYYQNNIHKGSSIGIASIGEDIDYMESEMIGELLLEFEKEISEKLTN
jgi:hypothetical protein